MTSVIELERIIGKNNVAIVDTSMKLADVKFWTDGITKVVNNQAYILIPRADGLQVRSPNFSMPFPLVIGLNRYVPVQQPKVMNDNDLVSKKAILIRDNWTCQYCSKYGDTIDHIYPKSRGGGNTWGNLCVACKVCNGLKSNQTPEEVGFKRPIIPRVFQGMRQYNKIEEAIYQRLEEDYLTTV